MGCSPAARIWAGAIEEVARLGALLLLQIAIEAEVTAFLGRERCRRSVSSEDARAGMRNGYCPTTVKTTAGPAAASESGDAWEVFWPGSARGAWRVRCW